MPDRATSGAPTDAPRPAGAPAARGADDRRVIHDVDQLLEKLVKRDALNGSSVDLVFDAPTKDWVARRSGPAVDLYLYDIREDLQRRVPAWEDVRGPNGAGHPRGASRPRRFRLAYLVTAWTQRPEDEHRLLSSLLALLPAQPDDQARGTSTTRSTRRTCPSTSRSGQPASQERSLADVWSALGGELKPSLDLVVIAPIVVDSSAYVRAAGPRGAVDRPRLDAAAPARRRPGHGARDGAADEAERRDRRAAAARTPAPKDGGVRIRVAGAPPRRRGG